MKKLLAGLLALGLLLTPALAQQNVNSGIYDATPDTIIDGQRAPVLLDSLRRQIVVVDATGGSTLTGCRYNTTLPTYVNGQVTECQSDQRGNLRIVSTMLSFTATDANSNIISAPYTVGGTTGVFQGTYPLDFNGSTWDRKRGDVNGSWAQGNVASGVADAGSPVKIGCVYNSTLPTPVTGQRVDCQADASGNIMTVANGRQITGADGIANNSLLAMGTNTLHNNSNRPLVVAPAKFNGSTWDREFTCANSAVINVTAAATTQLVALQSSQIIRVCSLAITMSAAGTAKFVYGTGTNCGTGTTDITGAFTLATGTPLTMGNGTGSVFRTIASNALCLTAVTGNVTGVVTYAQF